MSKKQLTSIFRIAFVLAVVALLLAAGAVMAQNSLPATEGGERLQVSNLKGQPDGVAAAAQAVAVASAGTDTGLLQEGGSSVGEPDGSAQAPDYQEGGSSGTETGLKADFESPQGYVDGMAPDDNVAREPGRTSAVFSYYTVAGPALQPRSTAYSQVYDGNGCIHMSSGTGTNLLTGVDLHIPEGSVIKYIRLYYNDTNASAGVDAFLTRYAPGTSTLDLVSTGSTNAFNAGYNFVVSNVITHTVSNAAYAYQLYGWPDIASSTLQVCGIRVAYYAPTFSALFLPLIQP